MSDWNPRYVAYARAHGCEPEQMLVFDAERFPGGAMSGFVVWISERWREWCSINRRGRDDVLSSEDHASNDAFIGEFAVSRSRP